MRLGDAVRIVNREAKNIEKAKTEIKKYLKTGEFSEMTIEEGRILDRINGKYGLSSFIEHNLRARPCKKYLKPQIESSVGFNGKDWTDEEWEDCSAYCSNGEPGAPDEFFSCETCIYKKEAGAFKKPVMDDAEKALELIYKEINRLYSLKAKICRSRFARITGYSIADRPKPLIVVKIDGYTAHLLASKKDLDSISDRKLEKEAPYEPEERKCNSISDEELQEAVETIEKLLSSDA